MLSKITVRLKLSDFINTDKEESIMKIINKTHEDWRATIMLHLWYENDEVSPTDVNQFLNRYQNLLSFKTMIRNSSELHSDEFIFFDVIPHDAPKEKYRFCYTYSEPKYIKKGLDELYNCVKFITSNKPNKRQKRNDYED
tara:strand:- start:3114 stop:3533 length:420 start_codon:yes stop_codon:yes gene_type:complete